MRRKLAEPVTFVRFAESPRSPCSGRSRTGSSPLRRRSAGADLRGRVRAGRGGLGTPWAADRSGRASGSKPHRQLQACQEPRPRANCPGRSAFVTSASRRSGPEGVSASRRSGGGTVDRRGPRRSFRDVGRPISGGRPSAPLNVRTDQRVGRARRKKTQKASIGLAGEASAREEIGKIVAEDSRKRGLRAAVFSPLLSLLSPGAAAIGLFALKACRRFVSRSNNIGLAFHKHA